MNNLYPRASSFRETSKHFEGDGIMLWGKGPEKKNEWLKTLLWIILFIIAAVVIWKWREPELKQHNKYMCAVYGYYEDCKTPLRPEDRLK